MTTINKNTVRLRANADVTSRIAGQVGDARVGLRSAVTGVHGMDFPEQGEVQTQLASLDARIQRSVNELRNGSQSLRGYARTSERIEELFRSYRIPFGAHPGSRARAQNHKGEKGGSGEGWKFSVGVERSKEEDARSKSFGSDAEELDPYAGNVWTTGAEFKLFGDDARFLESNGKFLFVPTTSYLEAGYEMKAFADVKAGRIAGGYRADAAVGARLQGSVESVNRVGNDHANVTSTGKLTATAEAKVGGGAQISSHGARAHVGGDIGVEAKAELKEEAKVSGVTGGMSIWGAAGAGGHAKLDGSVTLEKVHFEGRLGGSLGLGGGVSVKVDVAPKEVYGDAKHVAGGAAHAIANHADPRDWW